MGILLLTALGACDAGPKPGTAAGQLATLYSDSTRWCVKQQKCAVDAEKCADRWPTRTTARIAAAKLPEAQAQGCLEATLALDACALKLPCEEFAKFFDLEYCERDGKLRTCCFDDAGEEVPCPEAKCAEQEMRFVERCAPLERLIGT